MGRGVAGRTTTAVASDEREWPSDYDWTSSHEASRWRRVNGWKAFDAVHAVVVMLEMLVVVVMKMMMRKVMMSCC